ncbi:MAG: hypothetical protein LBD38_00385, partial [Streptococcaceae bacterium]|nr:hypothetical protein [Streptococcaceae bacterium]
LDDEHETEYREYLAEKYGRRKQMMTGIHINFSFDDGFFDSLREYYPEKSMIVLKNDIYLKLARNYLHFYWLIVYLFGATPKTSSGFYENETLTATPVRSIHNSSKGYENSYDVKVRFGSIDEYVKDLQKNIAQGRLRSEREFYNPVRLRRGEKAYELQLKGVQYLEFRGYDLNPFDENGITREGLRFIHLFLLYILTLDIEDFDLEMAAIKRAKVAMEPPNSKTAYFMEAIEFFEGMEAFYTKMNVKNQDKKILSKFKRMIQLPEETLSAKMLTYARMDADYLMRLAKEHKEKFLKLSRLFEMNEFPHHKELNEFIKKKFQSEKGEVKHEKMGKE